MNEFIEKLIGRLEEEHERCINRYGVLGGNLPAMEVKQCIEIVNQLAEEHKPSMTNGGCVDCDECIHRSEDCLCDISENEEVCPLASNNGWIPCGEIQPCKDGYYLITTSDGEIDVREYDYGSGWGWDGFERIIAWQPLPEPYKTEEPQWKQAMMNTFLKR